VGQLSDPYDQSETELGITISGLPGDLLEPEDGDPDADAPVDDAGGGDEGDPDETLVYDLGDWSEIERQAVGDRLREAGVAHAWDGVSLQVSPLDEAAVENVLDIVEGESAEPLDDDRDQVAYDMSEWDDDHLDRLVAELRSADIAFAWGDDELFVYADDEAAVDELVEQVTYPNELAAEPDDGPAGAEFLGDLFVAADRLRHDGEDPDGILAVLDLAQKVEGSEPPYGLGKPEWTHLCERVEQLSERLQEDTVDREAVVTAARDLRTALRPYV
jgi:hypothetical protein